MTILAGIDVGNATTEVVVGRATRQGIDVLAADRAPTRRGKGSPESLAAAVALLRRLERRHGLRVDRAVAAPLRPVTAGTTALPEDRPDTGRLHPVAAGPATTGGGGFGVGRPVRFGEPLDGGDAVVVVVPAGHRYDEVASTLAPLASSGGLAAVVLEHDEAVLVANRLPVAVPVVDEVPPDRVLGAARVAVEVSRDGRPLQVLTDPLKLAEAFGLTDAEVPDAAAIAGELYDVTSAAVALDHQRSAVPPMPAGWIEVAGSRVPFLEGHRRVRGGRVGDAQGYAVPPDLTPHPVDDLWTVDLGDVAASVLARRSAGGSRPVALAAMHAAAPLSDPAPHLADLLGVPVHSAPSEAVAARAGALSTPAAPEDAVVVDLGGGTIDVVSRDGSVVAAGAGDLLTAAVAALTGSSGAAAEWVKRGPAFRVETSQVLLGEGGDRTFLDRPAPPDSVGRLVVRGPAGLLAFSATMAPGEWRALRLRLKTDLVGDNVARALRSLDASPRTVVVVGGCAGDDEVLAAVSGGLPTGTAVGRGAIGGSLGHRYAVAYGLLRLSPG